MIREIALEAGVRMCEEPAPQPPPPREVLERVEALWSQQQAARGSALYAGQLFSVSACSPRELRGWFADYRWWLAQRCEPQLASALGVRPLGVTGLLRAGDATLFGRRSQRVLMNPGGWELAPSGGVEPSARASDGALSLVAQVVREAREELGIRSEQIARAAPLVLIEDVATGVHDVFVEIELSLSAGELASQLARAPRDEYDELACVSDGELAAWLARAGSSLDPVSRAALASSRARRP
jgi:hypothetical protein